MSATTMESWTRAASAAAGVILLGAACGAKKPVDAVEATGDASSWHGCSELRDRLEPSTANLTFSKLPAAGPPPPTWRLRAGEVSLAIPEGDYEILPARSSEQSTTLVLRGAGDRLVLIVRDPPDEPMEDVFLRVGELSSGAAKEDTARLFGGAPTSHDLEVLGFRHTLADLTCDAAREEQERPIAIALSLKAVEGPGELVSVHHDTYGRGDVARLIRMRDGRWMWEIRFSTDEATYLISLRAGSETEIRRIPAATRIEDASDQPPEGPPWLALLSAAMADPAAAGPWQALETWLAANQASAKSLEAVRSMLTR
jgi:hypothetical protein